MHPKHLQALRKVRAPKRVPTGVGVLAFVGLVVWASYACIWILDGIERSSEGYFLLGIVAACGLWECIKRMD